MQYAAYTVSVTNGSTSVIGTSTKFVNNIQPGHSFKITGDPVIYQVSAVVSDTQLTLSAPYAGATAYNVTYQITTDYTPNFKLAEINPGDADWTYHLTVETIRKIDEILTGAVSGYIVKGGWDASTNVPAIPVASAGNIGWTYRVVTAGTTNINGINNWAVGDTLISDGSTWFRIASVDAVVLENAELASDSATAAAASATSAATSATNAAASATSALASKTAAATSETNAVAAASSLSSALASFNTTFLGRHATDPLVDGSGNPILDGATYVNTVTDTIRVYSVETHTWANYDEAAQAAATSANLAATNASASATYALASKNAAAVSETNAGNSAIAASSSASAAATSASNANTSAVNALSSENAAELAAGQAQAALASLREVTSATVNVSGNLVLTFSDDTTIDTGHVVGAQGNGISTVVRTSGTGAPGTTDTYTITFTNAATAQFTVYNGADGIGSGDMLKSVYDPNGDGVIAFAQLSGVASNSHDHAGVYEPANSNIQSHVSSTSNPHGVTKTQVGLGNVDNTSDADKPISTAVNTALSEKASLGETSSTAYRGDRGKIAYDHSQVAHAPSDAEANVNADWNSVAGASQILNKPALGEMASKADVAIDGKQYVRKDKAWAEVVIPEGGITSEVKSGSFTAVNNRRYICDTTSAAFSCTLPSTPVTGTYLEFQDANGTWNTNNLTISRNGSLISGAAEDFICNVENIFVALLYTGPTRGWHITLGASTLTPAAHTIGSHSDWPSTVSMTEVGYLDGVTSNIQTQLASCGKLNVQQEWTEPQRPSLSSETAPSSNTVTWDLTTDQIFRINLNANITTFNLTGTLSSLAGYQYQAVVRFNGGTAITWGSAFKFEGGTAPTLTGTSGKVDIFNFTVSSTDGTNFYLLCTGMAQNL